MAEVKIEPHVLAALNDLITTLYEKEYFGFLDTAIDYAESIYQFMLTVPQRRNKELKNKRYGNYYASYKANNRTTWFVCFDIKDDLYLICFITNNHSADYPLFTD